jgi:hypothetical protein
MSRNLRLQLRMHFGLPTDDEMGIRVHRELALEDEAEIMPALAHPANAGK